MAKHKSEGHHWWPECVSKHWKDAEGCVNWQLPTGEIRRALPKNFGVIGNAHLVKLSREPGEETVWDENFEAEFRHADNDFPHVIDWLNKLDRRDGVQPQRVSDRFLPQTVANERLCALTECVVSLAVRSPMNRELAVGLAEKLRGPLPERERNSLIGLNMRRTQRMVSDSIGSRAKFAVIFSPERELIFGDGFFHNIRSPTQHVHCPKVLAPLTPNMAVLIARPMQFSSEPKLVTIVATVGDAEAINHAVQVYAKEAIFYRSERPEITDAFQACEHRMYAQPDNPIDSFIHCLPGVPPLDVTVLGPFLRYPRE